MAVTNGDWVKIPSKASSASFADGCWRRWRALGCRRVRGSRPANGFRACRWTGMPASTGMVLSDLYEYLYRQSQLMLHADGDMRDIGKEAK